MSKEDLTLKVSFLPPTQPCFNYVVDEMKESVVKDTANNFQMLQEVGNDKINVQLGREKFIINSINKDPTGRSHLQRCRIL